MIVLPRSPSIVRGRSRGKTNTVLVYPVRPPIMHYQIKRGKHV